jgi:hypothetical protein
MMKDVEGSGRGLFKVISQHLPGGTEENLYQDSQTPAKI